MNRRILLGLNPTRSARGKCAPVRSPVRGSGTGEWREGAGALDSRRLEDSTVGQVRSRVSHPPFGRRDPAARIGPITQSVKQPSLAPGTTLTVDRTARSARHLDSRGHPGPTEPGGRILRVLHWSFTVSSKLLDSPVGPSSASTQRQASVLRSAHASSARQ